MTVLTSRSQAVMDRLPSPNQDAEVSVTFAIADDTGLIQRTLLLSYDDWQSFGSPDRITVSVTAGDQLNQKETP